MRLLGLAICSAAIIAATSVSTASAITKPHGVGLAGCNVTGHATWPAGADVVLFVGQVTKTRGLATDYINAVEETSFDGTGLPTVNGQTIANSHQYWQDPIPSTDPDGWVTWWVYDTGVTLASGQTMTVSFNLVVSHEFRDGFGNVGEPGVPELATNTCTITGV